jgi:hypothetical protein
MTQVMVVRMTMKTMNYLKRYLCFENRKKLARALIIQFQKSCSNRRHEEIPIWKEQSEPLQGLAEDDTLVLAADTSAMQTSRKRNRKFNESHLEQCVQILSVSKKFPLVLYHCTTPGQTLGITDQLDTLRIVLSSTIHRVIEYVISVNTYIPVAETRTILCGLFIHTARKLKQEAYANRIKADVYFQKDVAGMV